MKNRTFSIFQLSWLLSTLTVFTFINSVNAQEWVQKADMINPRLFFSVSAVDNEIYVIGGTLADPIGSVEAYDPKTNKWVKKASMLFARAGVVSCEVGGKIYAIGGWNGQNPALGTVEEYDPSTDKWTQKAEMPTPRSFFAAVVADDKIYAIGGVAQNVGPLASI